MCVKRLKKLFNFKVKPHILQNIDAKTKDPQQKQKKKSLKILIYWGVKCKQAEQMSISLKYDYL